MEWSPSRLQSYIDFAMCSFDLALTSALISICFKIPICLSKGYAMELEANKTEMVKIITGSGCKENALNNFATFASAPKACSR
jgi:hypothetical protein